MTTSTPYDHTTPPLTPHASSQSPTPKLYRNEGPLRALISPRHYPSAAVYTWSAQPAPRESRTMARGNIRYRIRKGSSCPGREVPASNVQYWPSTATSPKGGGLSDLPQPTKNVQTTQGQDSSHKPKRSLLDNLQDDIPQNLSAPKTPNKVSTMATPKASPKPKGPTKLKDTNTWTSFIGWQTRRCEIFNKNFSFVTSSRRRPYDHTPPISPRTSISSDAGSPTPTPEEPFKRQRVDSSGSNVNQTAHPHCSPTHNLAGYNLGPVPTGPANIWGEEDIGKLRPIATRTEAHPGFLVDFTRDTHRSSSQRRRQEDDDDYHEYLDGSKRNNSFPSESRMLFSIDMDDHKPHAQAETLNKESRILGLSSNLSRRKRSCTLEAKTRKPHTPSCSSSSGSASAKTRTSSVVSDPSTDRFLTHVRASQEARAAKARDENVRKWLGNEPL